MKDYLFIKQAKAHKQTASKHTHTHTQAYTKKNNSALLLTKAIHILRICKLRIYKRMNPTTTELL